jgi:Ca2+-binding RTX toxin-like protein
MAFIALTIGTNADLGRQAAFDYGYYADTVLLLDSEDFQIRTYEGNDTVDLTRCTENKTHLVYLGYGDDRLIATIGTQSVYDGAGNDVVSLGEGLDYSHIGTGNDRIDGGAGFDYLMFEFQNAGDPNQVSNLQGVTCDLDRTTAQNFGLFGSDVVLNFEAIVGGGGDDWFLGTAGPNELLGRAGADRLEGRGGADSLLAGAGTDLLIGGDGADTIDLSADMSAASDGARDYVRYLTLGDSGVTAAAWDTIVRFEGGASATDDIIDLRAIDGNAALAGDQPLTWRGTTAAFSLAGGEVRLKIVGPDTYVCVDTDADSATEMVILVRGAVDLVQANFLL